MNVELLASIIQGEGGNMGPVGMTAVAEVLSCRIWQYNHSEERTEREWSGRAKPGKFAYKLAQEVVDRVFPASEWFWCMGHVPDVVEQKMKRGNYIIMNHATGQGLHLYFEDNVPYEVDK